MSIRIAADDLVRRGGFVSFRERRQGGERFDSDPAWAAERPDVRALHRSIIIGLLLSIPLWGSVIAAVWWACG